MKIEIYPHPLIDLREIDWDTDKIKILNQLKDYGNLTFPLDNYYISNTEIKNNIIFCEISIK